MFEYVKEDEKSDAVAAGAATDEQRAQQMEKEGEEGKEQEKEGENEAGEEGGEDDEKGEAGKEGVDGEDEAEGEEGEEEGKDDKSWRFSKSSKAKAIAPAEKEEKDEKDEEMQEGGKEVGRTEEEDAVLRREAAERQALLDGQQAISTNMEQVAKQDGSVAAQNGDDMQVDAAQEREDREAAEEAALLEARPQTAEEAEAAMKLWGVMEQRTSAQARELCEQLRLVLEPTLASKLKGDFKSGKRINLKKIIPFIASQFKRDKIWMRRTAPVKRTYQVLIAVDNSQSMDLIGAADYAREALAMIWKALAQLEVGDVGVIKFGDKVSNSLSVNTATHHCNTTLQHTTLSNLAIRCLTRSLLTLQHNTATHYDIKFGDKVSNSLSVNTATQHNTATHCVIKFGDEVSNSLAQIW